MQTFIVSLLTLLPTGHAETPAGCRVGRSFNECSDQRQILARATASARRLGRYVVVVYGYEACPWSRAMVGALVGGPRARAFGARFVVQPIVASRLNQTGRALMAKFEIRYAGSRPTDSGVPQVVVFDPRDGRGTFVPIIDLERNAAATAGAPARYGYDEDAVIDRIEAARSALPNPR